MGGHLLAGEFAWARLIALLRRAGMPLGRVRDVVDLPAAQRRAAVARWWAGVEDDVRDRRALVELLTRAGEEDADVYEVRLRDVPEAELLTREARLTVDELDGVVRTVTCLSRRQAPFPGILGAYEAVGAWVDAAGLARAGNPAEVHPTDRDAADPDAPHLEVAWPVG
ncbi:hypothetical protein LY71_102102 [Geodermatophilus tzadiensis]|uniref:GyrI-like small molecule binding protein n=1 Tax=Geodermatophilus tzadiensis TaxID=1137988 RepID=A0A2T0TZE2_9ACTN|nr:hypothetical protein [Geodermatophilus tzadiensis]PRY51039.1 hypothetical protein LY71_102102 [Geodermatophilus tzadiensis]